MGVKLTEAWKNQCNFINLSKVKDLLVVKRTPAKLKEVIRAFLIKANQ